MDVRVGNVVTVALDDPALVLATSWAEADDRRPALEVAYGRIRVLSDTAWEGVEELWDVLPLRSK